MKTVRNRTKERAHSFHVFTLNKMCKRNRLHYFGRVSRRRSPSANKSTKSALEWASLWRWIEAFHPINFYVHTDLQGKSEISFSRCYVRKLQWKMIATQSGWKMVVKLRCDASQGRFLLRYLEETFTFTFGRFIWAFKMLSVIHDRKLRHAKFSWKGQTIHENSSSLW